jgi:hypothetical protein
VTIRRWVLCKLLDSHSPAMGTCFSYNVGFDMWTYCVHCGKREQVVHVR